MPLFTFILMGTLTLISMVMTCFIPETKNKVMAETVHEQQQKGVAEEKELKIPGENGFNASQNGGFDRANQNLPSFDTPFTPFPNGSAYSKDIEAENGVTNQGYTSIYDIHKF